MSPLEILGDHTYRMVLLGTATIGLVSGALGSFANYDGGEAYRRQYFILKGKS